MIATFKTDVKSPEQVEQLTFHLNVNYPAFDVAFDLTDADSFLQIITYNQPFNKKHITELLNCLGFKAEVIPPPV